MNGKKMLIALCCVLLCVLALTACVQQPSQKPTTEPDPVVTTTSPNGETTQPPTQEVTEKPTEEATEPPTEEVTETPTQPASTGNQVNTGVGGDYNPNVQETEPEATEPPVIEVPPAGGENNPYYEQLSHEDGGFLTVSMAAGETVHYVLVTDGSFFTFADPNLEVTVGEETYRAENGPVRVELPADPTQMVRLQLCNLGNEATAFVVAIEDAFGSKTNPIILTALTDWTVALAEGDEDGIYYGYAAAHDGVLVLTAADTLCVSVTLGQETVELPDGPEGALKLPVKQGDKLVIQVTAKTDDAGAYPGVEAEVKAYLAPYADITVEEIPYTAQGVTVKANTSVFFRITGANGMQLTLSDSSAMIYCDDLQYIPDEQGVITLRLPKNPQTVTVEVCNLSEIDRDVILSFGYPAGHAQNPQVLVDLGELVTETEADLDGYYYRYTATHTGEVIFRVWEYPATEGTKTELILTNETTGAMASLWDGDTENYEVVLGVKAGDVVTIWVRVQMFGMAIDETVTVNGGLYGTQENPIEIRFPGFTANVPAGTTLYYQGYNLSDLCLTVTGPSGNVTHNGAVYALTEGAAEISVIAAGRMPAVFAIQNTGDENAAYEGVFTYPTGHRENPDALIIGENTVSRVTGQSEYSLNFTATKAGKLVFTFDSAATWCYTVDNLTQSQYGEIRFSNDDPQVCSTELTVKKGDTVQIRVNTYHPETPGENPTGTVSFTAEFITGPTHISNLSIQTSATLISGETAAFTGNFQGNILTLNSAVNTTVIFNGETYIPDSTGTISVEFPSEGSETLTFMIHNRDTRQRSYIIQFGDKNVGSSANPQMIGVGSYTMVQAASGGNDYYYKFVATKAGTLTFTFSRDVDAIFIINGSVTRYTHMGQVTYSLRVREGAVVNLVVNTYDPENPMVSPVGEVDFTVTVK